MTLEIAYVLTVLAAALVLFAWDLLPVDVVGLVVLMLLALPGVLTAKEAVAAFGDETVIVLIALFMLTAGIVKTGVVERIGLRLAAIGSARPDQLTRVVIASATGVSAFISNMVTTAVFLPILVGIARRGSVSLSKVLMPLAFGSILSSGVTVISTSTNLLVSSQLPRYGMEPLGFFEMAPAGIPITILGLLYLFYVAPRLIPDRTGVGRDSTSFDIRSYLSEVLVPAGSRLAGKSLAESRLGETLDVTVLGIRRDDERVLAPRTRTRLREGDVLLVEGRAEDILRVKDAAGVEILPEVKLSAPDLQAGDVRMIEGLVLPRSRLVGRTLRESRFRERTGLTALAIHSGGGPDRVEKISRTPIRSGDVLLLQGGAQDIARVRSDELLFLEDVSGHHPRTSKARWAALIFVLAVGAAALELLPLSIAFLAGVLAMVLTRCLTPEEAYRSVEWRLMVLVGSMLAFGVAMTKTGTADYLADLIVREVGGLGDVGLMAAFFLFTVALTQPMSNQAAALVVLPVAIGVAGELGMNPRSLVMTVTLAASMSFITPLEPSCVLVYGPGRYRFFDFVRVGALLTLITFVVAMLLIPLFWPPRGG